MIDFIGEPRFAPYLGETGGDIDEAFLLYEWNSELTAALWLPLCHFEVGLRNAFSTVLQNRFSRAGYEGAWIDDPEKLLDDRGVIEVKKAKRRLKTKRKSLVAGQIMSELGFGFWRFLVSSKYREEPACSS